jgi:hypothetical protein
VIKDGVLRSTPFLDASAWISSGGERGLLGLAFRPDYASSGRFFINFTNPQGHTVVARLRRSTGDPLVADPASRFDLVWPGTPGPPADCVGAQHPYICQPYANHNGGTIAFGPDGFLYIGMGDGGSGNDPEHRAQNPAELLGKILRIKVSVPDSDPEGYDIPPGNPFLAGSSLPAALDEIWAFGVRNPWKFSFDDPARGGTGGLVIGDVGQGAWEEIDYEPAGKGGRNYGWRNREGAHDNSFPFDPALPPAYTPLKDPIYEYSHPTGISITGGYVYRGSALGSSYVGRYFFADLNGRLWSLGLNIGGGGEATAAGVLEHTSEMGGQGVLGSITSFGVDAAGELYVISYGAGIIYRIVSNPSSTGSEVVMDLGSRGLWVRYNSGMNTQLHVLSPTATVTADLDGNGQADVIAAFQGFGVWVWVNNSVWYQLHTYDASTMVVGDLDGNGRADVLVDFPGYGVWTLFNNNWVQLHPLSPARMITADLDGNGRSEAVLDFPGYGVWIWTNNSVWQQLHVLNAAAMAAGDLGGNGRADVLLDFPGHGLWIWWNNTSWSQLHIFDATVMAIGDADASGRADAFISFPGYGVWSYMNNSGWSQLHVLDASLAATTDLDGTGRADVVLGFPGFGVWAWRNNADWIQLRSQDAEALAAGNLDGF